MFSETVHDRWVFFPGYFYYVNMNQTLILFFHYSHHGTASLGDY